MVKMKSVACGTLGSLVFTALLCAAAPKPAIIPNPGDWTVEVAFEHPQRIQAQLAPDRGPQVFWYTILTLTNRSGQDADFYPRCELMTDSFQILAAGIGVPPRIFQQVKKRHLSKYPLLESMQEAGNKILEGEDNAKDVAVIWPDFDNQAKQIKLFISGLSNETAVVDHPAATDEAGNAKKVYLRKTLELSYRLRGDPSLRSHIQLDYSGKRWVMR
jgi:hypothetical protein